MKQIESVLTFYRPSLMTLSPLQPLMGDKGNGDDTVVTDCATTASAAAPAHDDNREPGSDNPAGEPSSTAGGAADTPAAPRPSKVGVSFTFDSQQPCWVQLYWGVSATALSILSDGILRTEAPLAPEAVELRQRPAAVKRRDNGRRKNKKSSYTELESLDSPLRDKRKTKRGKKKSSPLPGSNDAGVGVGMGARGQDEASSVGSGLSPLAMTPISIVSPVDTVPSSSSSARPDPLFLESTGLSDTLYNYRSRVQYFPAGKGLTYTCPESEFHPVSNISPWSSDSTVYPLAIVIHVDTKAAHAAGARAPSLPAPLAVPALGDPVIADVLDGEGGAGAGAGLGNAVVPSDHGLYQITTISFSGVDGNGGPVAANVLKQVLVTEGDLYFEQQDIYGLETIHDPEEQDCPICMSELKDVILLPCRHLCVCSECVTKIDNCPLCREVFTSHVQFQGIAPRAASDNDDGSAV
eukprot:TRINITY_DN3978_c0_g1_i1.p1 TRINITY_DN3978_c0_g1~~TRINITY_DN3978_c0_g1_i1.p1  ORF type:complete len:466 (-),score=60.80 TRINITY_DN3978_c0_g1_i1:60-1457(-)